MKKLIEGIIVDVASRIEAKRKLKSDAVHIEQQRIKEEYKSYEQKARKHIDDFITGVKQTMIDVGCHLKAGDTAILNYYELDHLCRNGWDTGPDEILRNVSEKQKRIPLKVEITHVEVTEIYTNELIYNFFDQGRHLSNIGTFLDFDFVVDLFKGYAGLNKLWGHNYGLYFNASFKPINFDFIPRWSLNVGSFLKEGSNGAIFTEKYWKQRIDIHARWEEINSEKKEFDYIESGMLKRYRRNEI